MFEDQDQKFFLHLIIALVALLIIFRLVLMFVGVDLYIPYVDECLEWVIEFFGSLAKSVAATIGRHAQ